MIIAVDFDGTITEPSSKPKTGAIREDVIDVLKRLSKNHKLILWTCREGQDLEEAVTLCKDRGLTFDAINMNIEGTSRKVWADLYFDDKSVKFIGELRYLLQNEKEE